MSTHRPHLSVIVLAGFRASRQGQEAALGGILFQGPPAGCGERWDVTSLPGVRHLHHCKQRPRMRPRSERSVNGWQETPLSSASFCWVRGHLT